MKPTFSPESTEDMQQAIALLERAYKREMGCESSFLMGKLSAAIGDVHFVMNATSPKPVEPFTVVVLEKEWVVS